MANMKYYNGLLGTKEVAKRFKVTEATVINWARRGWLTYTDLSYGMERKIYGFRSEDILKFDPKNFRDKSGRKAKVKPYDVFFEYEEERDLYVITTAKKRDDKEKEENKKKNPKRAQSYWGFNIYFGSIEMMERFIELYEDLFLDSHTMEGVWSKNDILGDPKNILHIIVEKGTIPMIKDALGDLMKCKNRRYYIGCEPTTW